MALIVTPISIKEAIDDLSTRIGQVQRKTHTLIDYYIYPDPVPNAIDAYEPRLAALRSRLDSLGKINYPNLAHLLDDSDALAASYIIELIVQMLNAIHGIQELFENHYDRKLEDRKPFEAVYKVLEYRENQLTDVKHRQMTDPFKLRPEDLRPNAVGTFCRGAVQMINNRDSGKISLVDKSELLDDNRARLKRYGGAFLWWECPDCAFKLRYHVSNSLHSSIHSTDEIREHTGVKVEYKSAYLAKSHTYQPSSTRASNRRSTASGPVKYGCLFCYATGKDLEYGKSSFATGRELATHIAEKHRKPLPPAPLLQKLNVAVKERLPDRVERWDINFL